MSGSYSWFRPGRLIDICEASEEICAEPKTIQLVSGKPAAWPNILLMQSPLLWWRQFNVFEKSSAVRNEDGSFTKEI